MSIDLAIWLGGVALEATVVVVLLKKHIGRVLPVFLVFGIYNLLTDLSSRAVQSRYGYSSKNYLNFYLGLTLLDALMLFAVLVELSWSVLRPYRTALPRMTLVAISGIVLLVGGGIWLFTGAGTLHTLPAEWILLIRLQQTCAVLRILFFLGLAALSQMLAIGWRNRELQVATGLGAYSLASLGASLLHTHHESQAAFHSIDILVVVTYMGSLLYWTISFLQKEAPRQEFSPRMQSILFTVAGAARSQRASIDDIRKPRR